VPSCKVAKQEKPCGKCALLNYKMGEREKKKKKKKRGGKIGEPSSRVGRERQLPSSSLIKGLYSAILLVSSGRKRGKGRRGVPKPARKREEKFARIALGGGSKLVGLTCGSLYFLPGEKKKKKGGEGKKKREQIFARIQREKKPQENRRPPAARRPCR